MKHKLCLHGLEVKNQAQLLNLAKRLLPGSTVKVKIKEKYFNDNDMYKYRLTRFTPENIDGVRLYCAWGTLLVSDKLLAIADIIIEFEYHNAEAGKTVRVAVFAQGAAAEAAGLQNKICTGRAGFFAATGPVARLF